MIDEARQYELLQEQIANAVGELEQVLSEAPAGHYERSDDALRLAGAIRTTLVAASASLGECRQAVPYSTMRPVRDENGEFMWCCNHVPEHCD